MQIDKKYKILDKNIPNIPVEFVILHYTAQSLKGSLDIFLGSKPVSCHLLIDTDGCVYEILPCWDGLCKKAFHAGKSVYIENQDITSYLAKKNIYIKDQDITSLSAGKNIYKEDQDIKKDSIKTPSKSTKASQLATQAKSWENFNDFSIGIELINLNGNLFPFTKQQYQSLFKVLKHLKQMYPALNSENRILGHEHIAGFRGKKDPGFLFDWSLLFKEVYQKQKLLKSVLTKKQVRSLDFLKSIPNWDDKTAKKVSLILENQQAFWLKNLRLFFIKILSQSK